MSRSTQRLVCASLPRLLASGDRLGLLRGAHFKDEVVQSIGRHFGAVLAFDGLAILFLQEAKPLEDSLEELTLPSPRSHENNSHVFTDKVERSKHGNGFHGGIFVPRYQTKHTTEVFRLPLLAV